MQIETQELQESKLDSIESAIADIKAGKVVIVVDDEDRENEGDFICAAECVTPDIINFMVTHGRGLVCAPLTKDRADHLGLHMMVNDNTDPHKTAFTVSIDYKLKGCTTGISSYDRATCIRSLCDSNSKKEDFSRPGHVFPLIAKDSGVLRRTGHTEAAIDLAVLAGYEPVGVLIEILNEDGTMARLPQLMETAKRFDLKLVSIKDLVEYRMRAERLIELENSININTPFGTFDLISYKETKTGQHHLVLKKGDWEDDDEVLVRVHASTNAMDVLSTLMTGKDSKLFKALERISKEDKGAILLLRTLEDEKGMRRIMNAMSEQKEKGELLNPYIYPPLDTEQKEIGIGSQILNDLGLSKIKILTNNPRPYVGIMGYGLEIVDHVNF